jgi:hypothetical protein
MFSKKKREEKEAARSRALDAIAQQEDIKAKLTCPVCGGTTFSTGWKGLHRRTILNSLLFRKKEYDEHVLPFRFDICETCGLELTFVSFNETPVRYFSSEISKEVGKDEL